MVKVKVLSDGFKHGVRKGDIIEIDEEQYGKAIKEHFVEIIKEEEKSVMDNQVELPKKKKTKKRFENEEMI